MNFRSPLNKLLLALSVLAVVSAQLFGVGSDFLCDCSGVPVATASDHCHGPHGAQCDEEAEPAHSKGSCPDDGDALPHSQVAQDFRSAPASAAPVLVTEPLLQVVLTLDDSEWAKAMPVPAVEAAADERGSPPSGVAVSRTVVLLI